MAVTLETYQLSQPDGELEASLFPDDDMEEKLAGWLAQATTKVEADADIAAADQNEAAAAWVYYRAYTYIAQWMMLQASSAEADGLSRTISNDQRAYFSRKANEWLDKSNGYAVPTARVAFFGVAKAGRRHVSQYV